MKRMLMGIAVGIAAVGGFFLHDLFLNAYRMRVIPKNFSVVQPGVLYRSGQMRPEHFEEMLKANGIKTVVCLNPHDEVKEKGIAEDLGVKYVMYSMPGSGIGEPDLFHEYLRILGEEENRPVLVHCAAGAYRTGVAVALYRMHYQGWNLDDVLAEMAYSGCAVYGDQPLIDHVKLSYESIPADLHARVRSPKQLADSREF